MITSYMNEQREVIQKLREICRICELPVQIERMEIHLKMCEVRFGQLNLLRAESKKFVAQCKDLGRIILDIRGKLHRLNKKEEKN
jgi:hypothetical protein